MTQSHAKLLRWLAAAPEAVQREIWSQMSPADVRAFAWAWYAQPGQLPPPGEWRVWLLLAGRGFGKTRTGAEWVLSEARKHSDLRVALVGASLEEVSRVMIEGESGLLRCAPPDERLLWCRTRHELRFPSGAIAHAYSGADGERLRGPQHHLAWADELGKWTDAENAWDNLMLGLRLGNRQRTLVTTTPGNGDLLRRIMAMEGTEVRRGRTRDNLALPAAFIAAMESLYRDSRLGRQELDGELLEEADGALWSREGLERCRSRDPAQALVRIVVGVDPPATSSGDACGILVCGKTSDGRGLVLADASAKGERPDGWARKVVAAASAWNADRVVAEANNGGEMIEQVLRSVDAALPVSLVRASRGKSARAEPIAALFEVGKCGLAGFFPELEDELCKLTVEGYAGSGSPDRADAMVWALSELMLGRCGEPMLRPM